MKQADLIAELMAAQHNLSPQDFLVLDALGLARPLQHSGLIGSWWIDLSEDETLWEHGHTQAFITPCRVDPDNPNGPETTRPDLCYCLGELVDLVAWHPERPDRWALRTGNAGWLGACEPQMMGGHMIVRRSPLSWLKAGCVGVVPLSPFWQENQRLLAIADTLIAEDFEHAQELRQLMERPSYIPNVRVGEPVHVGAAGTVES